MCIVGSIVASQSSSSNFSQGSSLINPLCKLTKELTFEDQVVPSWFYSLHHHSVKELLEVVEDSSVPVGAWLLILYTRSHTHTHIHTHTETYTLTCAYAHTSLDERTGGHC